MWGLFILKQLPTYYDILEINSAAGNTEIKAAFRRLAKLYHPDKNPNGTEHFERILIAYEVLIDDHGRKQYDLKLRYGKQGAEHKTPSKKKEWKFTEEELKRRQYYQENYKKDYEKSKAQTSFLNKKTYNEYKYILFATPIAVALFMFVINGFEDGNPVKNKNIESVIKPEVIDSLVLNTGYEIYADYFKNGVFDKKANQILVLKNLSGYDGVFCVFGKKNCFLRSCFIKHGDFVELSQLPKEETSIKMFFGSEWKNKKNSLQSYPAGRFEKTFGYFKFKSGKNFSYSITFDENNLRAMEMISEREFFKKE